MQLTYIVNQSEQEANTYNKCQARGNMQAVPRAGNIPPAQANWENMFTVQRMGIHHAIHAKRRKRATSSCAGKHVTSPKRGKTCNQS